MEKDKPTVLEEMRRNRLSFEFIVNHKNSQSLKLRKEEILKELSEVAPLKVGDSVKIQGYKDKYIIKAVRPYINTNLRVNFMYHLRQEGTINNFKYNVDSCELTKIK